MKNKDTTFESMCLILCLLLGTILVGIITTDWVNEYKQSNFIPDQRVINNFWRGTKHENKDINKFIDNIILDTNINDSTISMVNLGEFKLTGYCDCEECQEEWVGTTALGVAPQTNHTIAVDPSVIPLGSKIMIDGFDCIFVAEDVGGMINENHIDIFMETHFDCYSPECNRYANVYLIKDI